MGTTEPVERDPGEVAAWAEGAVALLCTSPRGAAWAVANLDPRLPAFASGGATLAVLRRTFVRAIPPAGDPGGAGAARALLASGLVPGKLLFPGAEATAGTAEQALAGTPWRIAPLSVYRTLPRPSLSGEERQILLEAAAVVFASPSSAAFLAGLDPRLWDRLRLGAALATGGTTAEALAGRGWSGPVRLTSPDLSDLPPNLRPIEASR